MFKVEKMPVFGSVQTYIIMVLNKSKSGLGGVQKKLRRHRRTLLTFSVLLVLFVVINRNNTDDISCYTLIPDGDIPSAEDKDFEPPQNAIFFFETSCRKTLNSRQACAVESAARAHPNRTINVYFLSPIERHLLLNAAFDSYKNIQMLRLHLFDFVKGTPTESIFTTGLFKKSKWVHVHTSDILRFTMLYKWPGIYMDLDMVVVKPFDGLGSNWVAREGNGSASVGIIAFSHDELGRLMANKTAVKLSNIFNGDNYGDSGPALITSVLQELCSVENVTDMSEEKCKGFKVYGPEMFYPIQWRSAIDYFLRGTNFIDEPYTLHVWNHLTKDYKVLPGSLYARYAEKYCPNVFMIYGDQFGI